MKKIIFSLGIVCLALVSCNKSESPDQDQHLKFNISVGNLTKATKSTWENGDRILLFFNKELAATPRYVTMEFDGSKWSYTFNEATLETGLLGTTSGTVSAVFVPYWKTLSISFFTGWGYDSYYLRFFNETETDDVWTYYLRCQDASYSVSAGVITASLTMEQPGSPRVSYEHFWIPGLDGYERYTLQASNLEKVASCLEYSFDSDKENFGSGVASYNDPIPGYPYQGGVSFSGNIEHEGVADDYTFILTDTKGTADTSDDQKYQISFTGKTIPERGAVQLPALTDPRWTTI